MGVTTTGWFENDRGLVAHYYENGRALCGRLLLSARGARSTEAPGRKCHRCKVVQSARNGEN